MTVALPATPVSEHQVLDVALDTLHDRIEGYFPLYRSNGSVEQIKIITTATGDTSIDVEVMQGDGYWTSDTRSRWRITMTVEALNGS